MRRSYGLNRLNPRGRGIYVSGHKTEEGATISDRPTRRRAQFAIAIALVVLVALGSMLIRQGSTAPADTRAQGTGSAHRMPRAGWSARAELPWRREWASRSCADQSRVKRVGRPRLSGRWAYRLEVRDGDDSFGERCELGQGNPTRPGFPLFTEGQERWISFSVFLPRSYPMPVDRWNILAQLKGLEHGGPPIAIEARRGRFALTTATDSVQDHVITRFIWSGRAFRERWTRFTLRVKFSPNLAVGFVELYGSSSSGIQRLLMPRTHAYTMKRDKNGTAIPSHSRIGPYRDPAITGKATLYYDDYVVTRNAPSDVAVASRPN